MHVIDLRNDYNDNYVVKPTGAAKIETDINCIRIYTDSGYLILIDNDALKQIKETLAT